MGAVRLKPLLFAMAAGLSGIAAHAGSCNVTTPGAATCVIPAGITSVNVVATGGGGGGGSLNNGTNGGAGGVVTATLNGVGGTTLNLFVGGGGGGGSSGGGGGSSNVNAGTASQIIAGGGGGGSFWDGGSGNGGNGSNGGRGGDSAGGSGGVGGVGGGLGSGFNGLDGGSGNGGAGGAGYGATNGGSGSGSGNGGGANNNNGGGGGGGFGGGGGGGWASGGGGGGSTGGVVTVASNGGGPHTSGGDGSIIITWTVPVETPPVTEPIPVTVPTTSKVDPGVSTAVTPKDLSSGKGPALVVCLKDALAAQFATTVTYLGQNPDGSARYGIASSPAQTLSFYPLTATTDTGSGITLGNNNALTVATRCGTFTTEPALFNRSEFGAVVSSMGLAANISAQGVISIQSGSTIYVGRPDYLVTTGQPGAPSLKQGSDGLWRFTDSAGNVQVMRPAFLEPDVLRSSLFATLPGFVSFIVQTDGTGVLTTLVNGMNQTSVWTAAQTLGTVSADHWADSIWGSGANWTYRVYSFPRATQGYTAVQR